MSRGLGPGAGLITRHGESPDEQADVPAAHHDDLAAVDPRRLAGVLVLPRRPDADGEDDDVEEGDGHQSLDVDGHGAGGGAIGGLYGGGGGLWLGATGHGGVLYGHHQHGETLRLLSPYQRVRYCCAQ